VPPNSYYIQPRDLAADFRQGSARAHVTAGRYDDAARTIGADDPAAAQSYAQMADRERLGQEREETRSYARDYAGAIHRGDYQAAGARAAQYGDVEGVTGARSQEQSQEEQQIVRAAAQYWQQLRQIDEAGGEGYAEMVQRARQAVAQNPGMHPDIRRMAESLPDEYNPRAIRAVQAQVQSMLLSGMDAEEINDYIGNQQEAAAGRRRNLTPEEARAAGLQPGTVAQTDGSGQIYVVQNPRAPRSAGEDGFGPSGLSGDQVRAEREFSRDWRGVYNNFSEIRDSFQRIQTVSARRDAAGDLALVVAFTKMLDPGSVAREGEVALTQSAASALAQAQNFLPRLQQGNTLLPPQVRNQLVEAARAMYANYESAYHNLANDYGGTADQYGFDRSRVMMGYRPREAPPPTADGASPAADVEMVWDPQQSRYVPRP
jgi:hypothetical protein